MKEMNTTDKVGADQVGSDLINEQVSALLDGELPRDQLRLRTLERAKPFADGLSSQRSGSVEDARP